MTCHCAELTERGLPPPPGFVCDECGPPVASEPDVAETVVTRQSLSARDVWMLIAAAIFLGFCVGYDLLRPR